MTSDDEKTTPSSEFTGKKKPKSGKRTPVELQHNNHEEVTKKKHKKKALAQEDVISSHEPETIEMVPKKVKKKKVFAKDTASCDYKGNDLAKKKKKKNVLDKNIASCDSQTNDVPKKKNISDEDIASLDCKSNDVPKKKKKNVLEEDNTLYDTKTNIVPKKKKKKNVLEEDDNTSCNTQTYYVSKKKKKKKFLDNEIVPCDPLTNDDIPKKKKKNDLHEDFVSCDLNMNDDRPKKKKKKKVFDEIEPCDPKASVHLRKKKKKTVLEEDDPLHLLKCKSEPVGENSQAPSLPKSKIVNKKKKKGIESSISSSDNPKKDRIISRHKNISGTPIFVENKLKTKQLSIDDKSYSKLKKNKKKNSQPDEGDSGDETIENGDAVTEDSKVKKKKKGCYDTMIIKDARSSAKMSPPEVSEILQVKKRGKMSPLHLEDADLDKHSVHLSELSKNPGKDVLCPQKTDGDNSEQKKKRKIASPDKHLQSSNVHKTRDGECDEKTDVVLKKKIKKGKEVSVNAASHKGLNKEMSKKRKRKMDEKLKNAAEEHSTNKDTSDVPEKKKKKGEIKQKLKKTEKDSIKHTNPDVQLVSVKAGNADELHIDTVRRKALQEDIDRESGNTKSSGFGQWATASFQSSDQQTKFFRLLGGFKKGNQTTPPPTSSQEKTNMALGKEGAQNLERNLLAEFDKALAWKQNRGIGLGCQPAQKKIFYIDKTKSKSVKFED